MAKKKETPKEKDQKEPVVTTQGLPGNQTPKQKCEADHAGQAGYCDDLGNWHPYV